MLIGLCSAAHSGSAEDRWIELVPDSRTDGFQSDVRLGRPPVTQAELGAMTPFKARRLGDATSLKGSADTTASDTLLGPIGGKLTVRSTVGMQQILFGAGPAYRSIDASGGSRYTKSPHHDDPIPCL